jgi:hypothetical protein
VQRDFHYEGTYVLARLAGFGAQSATRIATAAQFVDDATTRRSISHPEGSRFQLEPTGHALGELNELNDPDDQIRVWVPFHFLPGGAGPGPTQRLICWPDSRIANEVLAFARAQAKKEFGLEALGVAVHAYADTFAHFGFSGVSSRLNRVVATSIKLENAGRGLDIVKGLRDSPLLPNFRAIASDIAELATGALGHGGVAICPDTPYLKWSYSYERGDLWGNGGVMDRASEEKSNPYYFLKACERIHAQLALCDEKENAPVPFESVRDTLRSIIATVGDADRRSSEWRSAVRELRLPIEGDIPTYGAHSWLKGAAEWSGFSSPALVRDVPLYRFMQAAALHRNFVLRELLPANGICLV